MGVVTEAWARIEEWLARHTPASAAALAPPADPADIAAAEAALGLAFPPELVESLRRHDGQRIWANILPKGRRCRPPASSTTGARAWTSPRASTGSPRTGRAPSRGGTSDGYRLPPRTAMRR